MDTAVHTYEATPEPSPRPPASAPQLRTLLLTDLVDSTGLVERLGDTPASDLFRAHDRLVLQLQQQWRGRLIDRSDGLLLLFERPIDGLGFALDYARGLIVLGNERGIELRARAGMHVGEVLTWRNSDEAVSVGAKPLEVEGLAKPIAARLMVMARPGQILLSAVAEPLAHRAARELGERGQHLLWKSWGRWRFKGLPEAQQVFEVGEPGVAPLRIPPSTPKAWRDIPIWRRPAALAAELALLVGGLVGVWFLARPEPAIAFNQRDWVVVGDLRNLTGQSALDDSLEQAFRISLEQSRHVNVLSDLKARDTLGRMRRAPDTVLDRAVASEIAVRDGARAVILPTVAEIGGRVRVSAEVIDPRTQTTVYAESEDGTGIGSVLGSIDAVTAALRGRLGEAVKSIEQDSAPLPQVTTKNLDALRAYALGQKAYARAQHASALQFFERATELDPQFALAWLGQVRARYSLVDAAGSLTSLRRAQALRANLPSREALYLDAWLAELDSPAKAPSKWKELADFYPDFWPAQGNAALALYRDNRFKEALPYAKRNTATQNELASIGWDWQGRAQLGLEQYLAAGHSFARAAARGYYASSRRAAATEAAQRNFASANRLLRKLRTDDRHAYIEKASIAIDQGQWSTANSATTSALKLTSGESGFDSRMLLLPSAVASWLGGDESSALNDARNAIEMALASLSRPDAAEAIDDAELALAGALLAQRLGDRDVAKEVVAALNVRKELLSLPRVTELVAVVRAEELRLAGRPEEAIMLLTPMLTGHERYQTRVALLEALLAVGQIDAALQQSRWLQQHRGFAYVENTCGFCLQPMNVADSNVATLREAELLEASGRADEAKSARESFGQRWPTEALPPYFKKRRVGADEASS